MSDTNRINETRAPVTSPEWLNGGTNADTIL